MFGIPYPECHDRSIIKSLLSQLAWHKELAFVPSTTSTNELVISFEDSCIVLVLVFMHLTRCLISGWKRRVDTLDMHGGEEPRVHIICVVLG